MNKRKKYSVTLENAKTGAVHVRTIFAVDEQTAQTRSVERARKALSKTMVDANYGQYKVLACTIS